MSNRFQAHHENHKAGLFDLRKGHFLGRLNKGREWKHIVRARYRVMCVPNGKTLGEGTK